MGAAMLMTALNAPGAHAQVKAYQKNISEVEGCELNREIVSFPIVVRAACMFSGIQVKF